MSKEKFIAGKHDKGHHDGKRSNLLRLQEALQQVKEASVIKKPELPKKP